MLKRSATLKSRTKNSKTDNGVCGTYSPVCGNNGAKTVLRLNGDHFKHVTELDVSENGLTSLDASCLERLAVLRCSKNDIGKIVLHGASLISLTADNNSLSVVDVKEKPSKLSHLNITRNRLSTVPSWLESCEKLHLVDASHNAIEHVPQFLTSGQLPCLQQVYLNHNSIRAFHIEGAATDVTNQTEMTSLVAFEVLCVHSNDLTSLPEAIWRLPKLRVLNVSSNRLSSLPRLQMPSRSCSEPTPPLQEFYAGNNQLRDLSPLALCQSLQKLHVPYNRITALPDRLVNCWQLLQELVVSGNQIMDLPSAVSRLSRLTVLRLHHNPVTSLPRLAHLSHLKIIDASHCCLGRLELESVVSPSLLSLDVAANTALNIDKHQFSKCRSRRSVSVVDATCQPNRTLPLSGPAHCQSVGPSKWPPLSPCHGTSSGNEEDSDRSNTDTPHWNIGFAETVGSDSKLNISQLRIADFQGKGTTALVAMGDGLGGSNTQRSTLWYLPSFVDDEFQCHADAEEALKYALLTAIRKQLLSGGTIPEFMSLVYLSSEPNGPSKHRAHAPWPLTSKRPGVLHICSYGEMTAVTVTSGQQLKVISASPAAKKTRPNKAAPLCKSPSECSITPPQPLPDPKVTTINLSDRHRFLIIAAPSLWEVLEPKEANEVCTGLQSPSLIAKKLLSLAQSYGCKKAISIIVADLVPMKHPKQTSRAPHPNENHGRSQDFQKQSPVKHPKTDQKKKNTVKVTDNVESTWHAHLLDEAGGPPFGEAKDNAFGQDCTSASPPKVVKPKCKVRPILSSCQFPRPELVTSRKENVRKISEGREDHLYPEDILTPPAGFADSDADSVGSDSGFSGNSDGKSAHTFDVERHKYSEDSGVSEEQYRGWEYLLARNAKLLYLRELGSLKDRPPVLSSSVPNLVNSSADEGTYQEIETVPKDPSFCKNVLTTENRKPRFGKGTLKLLQSKLSFAFRNRAKSTTLTRINGKSQSFKRFGSLQDLKYYQQRRSWLRYVHPRASQVQFAPFQVHKPIEDEMTEKRSLDLLESRMQHYWNTGVTCF